MRIVSLLPAATEVVCALDLDEQLVGVTHECDFPPVVRQLPKVTRSLIPSAASSLEIDRLVRERSRTQSALYTLNVELLEELRPDLIVTQALCDVCAVAEDEVQAVACALPGNPRVINLEPQTIGQVFDSVRQVARATDTESRGASVVEALTERVNAVAERSAQLRSLARVAFLEWLDPPFSCGHWTPELVRLAGGVEGLSKDGERSRTLEWSTVVAWEPEVIVVACCGFDVDRAMKDLQLPHILQHWQPLSAARAGRLYVIDGSQYFSRPGPRLVDSLEILAHALHPDVHPLPNGLPYPRMVSSQPDISVLEAIVPLHASEWRRNWDFGPNS